MPPASTKLADLPKLTPPTTLRPAWKYLQGAHGSVSALLDALTVVRGANMNVARKDRGRLSNDELELLRAALVFTSSGLDASMHRLVRDVLPRLAVAAGTGSALRYQEYRKSAVREGSDDFVAAVCSPDPHAAMLAMYVRERTKASYQGSSDLRKRVRETLGIPKAAIPDADLSALDPFFMARNDVVHDLDYVDVKAAGFKRHHRAQAATVTECNQVFAVAARFIQETAYLL